MTSEPTAPKQAIRWLLVIPAAMGAAVAMAVIAALSVFFSSASSNVKDVGAVGKVIIVFVALSAPMASINVGAGQAPGHKETVAMVLAALWALGLTAAVLYVAALGGVHSVVDWLVFGASCAAGVTGVVWGFFYARTEGEAAT